MAIQTRSLVFAVYSTAIGYYLENDISGAARVDEIVKIDRYRMYKFCNQFFSKFMPILFAARRVGDALNTVLLTVTDDVMYGSTD
jgi:hypothetical protein